MASSAAKCSNIPPFTGPSTRKGSVKHIEKSATPHTITGDWIRRDQALALVKRVPPNLQAMIAAERVRLGLSIDDDEPVGPDDQRMYREMMERIQDP